MVTFSAFYKSISAAFGVISLFEVNFIVDFRPAKVVKKRHNKNVSDNDIKKSFIFAF